MKEHRGVIIYRTWFIPLFLKVLMKSLKARSPGKKTLQMSEEIFRVLLRGSFAAMTLKLTQCSPAGRTRVGQPMLQRVSDRYSFASGAALDSVLAFPPL